MRVRVLYFKRKYPEYQIGRVYDMPQPVAAEYLSDNAGEPVRGEAVETAVAPPASERAVEREEAETEAVSEDAEGDHLPEWPLKTKTPAEYVEEYGDTPEDELSPSVAANLELARRLVEA